MDESTGYTGLIVPILFYILGYCYWYLEKYYHLNALECVELGYIDEKGFPQPQSISAPDGLKWKITTDRQLIPKPRKHYRPFWVNLHYRSDISFDKEYIPLKFYDGVKNPEGDYMLFCVTDTGLPLQHGNNYIIQFNGDSSLYFITSRTNVDKPYKVIAFSLYDAAYKKEHFIGLNALV